MDINEFYGILIPFLGTSAGAALDRGAFFALAGSHDRASSPEQ